MDETPWEGRDPERLVREQIRKMDTTLDEMPLDEADIVTDTTPPGPGVRGKTPDQPVQSLPQSSRVNPQSSGVNPPSSGVNPHRPEWSPQLVYEANLDAPWGGAWRVYVPVPEARTLTNRHTGEPFTKMVTRWTVGVFDTDTAAASFADAVWRETHGVTDPTDGPRLSKREEWHGELTPEAQAWLDARQAADGERVICYHHAASPRFRPAPGVFEPTLADLRRQQWDVFSHRDPEAEGPDPQTLEGPLGWHLDEQSEIFVQHDRVQDAYFLWTGMSERGAHPLSSGVNGSASELWSEVTPVSAVPLAFPTEQDARRHAHDLGYHNVTPTGDAWRPQAQDASGEILLRPEHYRAHKVPYVRWPTAVKAQDKFDKACDVALATGIDARWDRPVHPWNAAPIGPEPGSPWVAWRVRAGVHHWDIEPQRDPENPRQWQLYDSLEAVRDDLPGARAFPVPSRAVDGYLAQGIAPEPRPDANGTELAPLLQSRTSWRWVAGQPVTLTSVVESTRSGPRWAASILGGEAVPWNDPTTPLSDGHDAVWAAWQTTRQWPLKSPESGDVSPPPQSGGRQIEDKRTSEASPPGASDASPPPRQEPEFRNNPLGRVQYTVAPLDENRWGLYLAPQFRGDGHHWLAAPRPTVTQMVAPDRLGFPAIGRLDDDVWIALPRDYQPKRPVVDFPSREAAEASVQRMHAKNPDFYDPEVLHDTRPLAEIRWTLAKSALTTDNWHRDHTTCYTTAMDATHYAAWVEVPWTGQRAWIVDKPTKGQPPRLATQPSPQAWRTWLSEHGLPHVEPDPRPSLDVHRELFHEAPGLRLGSTPRGERPTVLGVK